MTAETGSEGLCENDGCGRPASAGQPRCDICELEWSLYRRDLRLKERPHPRPEREKAPITLR